MTEIAKPTRVGRKLEINEVTASLFNLSKGRKLTINREGFCGKTSEICSEGEKLMLSVKAEKNRYVGISIDDRTQHVSIICSLPSSGGDVLSREFFIRKTGSNLLYPDNQAIVRLLMANPSGQITMNSLMMVSQDQYSFLIFQEDFSLQAHQSDEGVVLPGLREVKGSREFICFVEARLQGLETLDLPHIKSYKELVTPLEVNRVLWYSLKSGVGVVHTPSGAARVHWSQVPRRADGLHYLCAGEKVVYEGIVRPKGNTTFAWELNGVKLVPEI